MSALSATSASREAERRALRPTGHPVRWIVIGAVGLVVVLVFGLIIKHAASWDAGELAFDKWFATHRNSFGNAIASLIDHAFGPAGAVVVSVVFALVVWFLTKSWWRALVALVVLLGCWIPVVPISEVVHRVRPGLQQNIVVSAKTYSYPSGHAAYTTALVITTWFTLRDRRIRRFAILCGVVLFLIVGWSRVYLGLHYPTDVLAGCATAIFAAMVGIPIIVDYIMPAIFRAMDARRPARRRAAS